MHGVWPVAETLPEMDGTSTASGVKTGNVVYLLPYVSPEEGMALRAKGVQYLDLSGNVFVADRGFHLHVDGARKVARLPVASGSAFGKKGLRVLFVLLSHPELIRSTIRALAQAAGVSHGTAQNAVNNLRALGLMEEVRGVRTLVHKGELLDRWAYSYVQTLRSTLIRGRYRPFDEPRLANEGEAPGVYWSGDVAASSFLGTLVPKTFIAYVSPKVANWASTLRLMPDPEGRVEVLSCFWNTDAVPTRASDVACVPIPLAYADLLHLGDARSRDAARLLKEQWEQ